MITTYFGKGTEWLDSNHIDPGGLSTYNAHMATSLFLEKHHVFILEQEILPYLRVIDGKNRQPTVVLFIVPRNLIQEKYDYC